MLCQTGTVAAPGRSNFFRLKGTKLTFYTVGASGGSAVTAEASYDFGSTWVLLGTITVGTAFQVPDICTDTDQSGVQITINSTGGAPAYTFAIYDNR